MAIIKKKLNDNFTQISNNIFNDKRISMKDKGVYCTLCSLADGWRFSIEGIAKICSDGKDSIRNSINNLEKEGYITRTQTRDGNGHFDSIIEIHAKAVHVSNVPPQEAETDAMMCSPSRETRHGISVTVNPSPESRHGNPVTEKSVLYNTKKSKTKINIQNTTSIPTSMGEETDGEAEKYRTIIAQNIKLDQLLETAKTEHNDMTDMINDVYNFICDMVCHPRAGVKIRNTTYPWDVVKSSYLKLSSKNVLDVITRIAKGKPDDVTDMYSYLTSSLYCETLTGALKANNMANANNDSTTYSPFLATPPKPKSNRFDYPQRTYTDEEMIAFEKKKLGIEE